MNDQLQALHACQQGTYTAFHIIGVSRCSYNLSKRLQVLFPRDSGIRIAFALTLLNSLLKLNNEGTVA